MTVGFCGKRIYANVEWEFIVCGMSYLLVGEMLKWDDSIGGSKKTSRVDTKSLTKWYMSYSFMWVVYGFPQMGLSFLGIYHASAAYNLSLTKKEEVCIGLV